MKQLPSVADLQDMEAIRQVKARYVRYGDTKNWEGFRELLTEDFEAHYDGLPRATQESPSSGGINGLDMFLQAFPAMLSNCITIHHLYSNEIVITGSSTATGIWAMHDVVNLPTCTFRGWGHYHEEYEKLDGQWKIKKIRVTRLQVEEEWL